jgi:hypothetical protein
MAHMHPIASESERRQRTSPVSFGTVPKPDPLSEVILTEISNQHEASVIHTGDGRLVRLHDGRHL